MEIYKRKLEIFLKELRDFGKNNGVNYFRNDELRMKNTVAQTRKFEME